MDFLSRREKQKGRKSYLIYTFVNGLSYSFLAETIITLLAIYYGASNIQLGYINSAVYLTGLIVFFVPILFKNARIIRLFFVAWMLRGLVSLGYGFTPLLSAEAAVWLIIGVYTLYCLLRNIAYPMNHVIQGYITKPSERGRFASKILTLLYTSMTLSRFLSFTTLTLFVERKLEGFFCLLGLGIILNTWASAAITKIPVKQKIKGKRVKEALTAFGGYLADTGHRVLILLYCSGMSLFVTFGLTIAFLRKTLDVPDNLIFIYTMLNFAGVIVISRGMRPYLDRFGSRPLLVICNILIFVFSLLWVFTPVSLPIPVFFGLGVLTMAFLGLNRLLLDRLIVNSIPADDRVGFTGALAVVFSFFALLVGMAGGYLADLSVLTNPGCTHEYGFTFALMALTALVNVILAIILTEKESLSASQLLDILSHPDKLRTIQRLEKLENSSSSTQTEMILIELEADPTHLATKEIQSRMRQPGLRDKEMIIRSLFSNPRPELEDELIAESLDTYSWWRQSAIFALGAYNTPGSRQALRRIFRETSYPYIRSVAAKSMARVGDFSCLPQINELLSRPSLEVRTYVNLIIAASMIERDGSYWKKIFRLLTEFPSFRFQQTLLIIGSKRAGFEPPLEDYFFELNMDESSGFQSLFEDLVDFGIEKAEYEQLKLLCEVKDYFGIWSFARARCKEISLLEPHEILRQQICGCRKRSITPSLALAGIYFSFQFSGEYEIWMNKLKQSQRAE
ncbi:MAG: MFS transporter [Spirochaetales bacterium]|uniref:MFS transporter n=1 Tax=Candidatus Thalassospirochaeta sargassi TaxID=3119039 RepID=A0AAJ1IFI0_9SPIO|nr:MFS transporter [Spirochaetales bacterium]